MAEVRRFPTNPDRLAAEVRDRIADLAAQLVPGQRLSVRADHDDDCACWEDLDRPCNCEPEVVVGVEYYTFQPPWVSEGRAAHRPAVSDEEPPF